MKRGSETYPQASIDLGPALASALKAGAAAASAVTPTKRRRVVLRFMSLPISLKALSSSSASNTASGPAWLHQFRSRQVRVVKIQLPLAVPSDLRTFGWCQAPALYCLVAGLDVRNSESHVVHDAERAGARVLHVQHVLVPIGAIGHPHVHPIDLLVRRAAVPELAESENIAVEVIVRSAVGHRRPHVDDPLRHSCRRQKLPEIARVQRTGQILDELHVVAVGVFDHEAQVPVGAFRHSFRYLHAIARKVVAKLWSIVRLESNVREDELLRPLDRKSVV